MNLRFVLPLLIAFFSAQMSTEAQSGIIRGEVYDLINNAPVAYANVFIQGSSSGVSTDELGKFSIENLAPGLYNVGASFIGYKTAVVYEVQVSNARPAYIRIGLESATVELSAAEVSVEASPNREEAPLSLRTIGANEVRRSAGGNRDVSRALRSLPGVASPPSFRNDIIVRGGAPNENRFFIDGIEIPTINHFATQGSSGGPVGIINVDLIDNVSFYSGAFPASRGNALSSVMDFGFKDGRSDKAVYNAVLGSSDVGLTYDGPTGENSSLVFSVRRSYLQYLFQALALPFLPTYNDAQFKWKYKIDDHNQLTVLGIGAIDQFALNTSLDDPASEDYERNRYLLEVLPVNEQWNYTIGVKWDHFIENGSRSFIVSRNMLNNVAYKHPNNDTSLPQSSDYESQEMENKFRWENKLYLKKGWKAGYGLSYVYARYLNNSRFQRYSYENGGVVDVTANTALDLHSYGAYGNLSKGFLAERLLLSVGLRADGSSYASSMSNPLEQLSPRFSASYSITEKLRLNFNTGQYYQLPAYTVMGYTEDGQLKNKEQGLKYIQSTHWVGGLQYDLGSRNTVIGLEFFHKSYHHYPASVDKGISLANLGADFGVIGNEAVVSASQGKAKGMEFLLQQKLFKGYYGILSYTFVRSSFDDLKGQSAPSSWDSRHLISLTGGKKFAKNWELGMRFLYSGGVPYTPYDLDASLKIENWQVNNAGIPDYGLLNTLRIQAYHQLDLRIDKKWYFEKWSIDLYLDIQNIYNQQTELQPTLDVQRNAEGVPLENPDKPGYYMPSYISSSNGSILPSIGIIVEL